MARNSLAIAANWMICFTFLMAFVIACAPFGTTDSAVIGVVLLVLNVAILFVALNAQRKDFKKKRQLLALKEEVKQTQKGVVGLAYVRHTLSYRDRRRFFEDYSHQFFGMSYQALMKLAKDRISADNKAGEFMTIPFTATCLSHSKVFSI